jgi:hypothetical protein
MPLSTSAAVLRFHPEMIIASSRQSIEVAELAPDGAHLLALGGYGFFYELDCFFYLLLVEA